MGREVERSGNMQRREKNINKMHYMKKIKWTEESILKQSFSLKTIGGIHTIILKLNDHNIRS